VRGRKEDQDQLFSYVGLEEYVPMTHPLRRVRQLVDSMLEEMDEEFERLYSDVGRPSIPPEQLLRSLVLQILYSVRSERMLVEQLQYNLLFKWFVGLQIDETVWNATTFTKNRDRLLGERVARLFFEATVKKAKKKRLLSDEHFTVDGTLIESYASLKSFRPKDKSDRDPEDFHGKKRKNDTHESVTDPEARLYRKGNGKEARLYYTAHVLSENRNGLVCDVELSQANGTAEVEHAAKMLERVAKRSRRRRTCGADKAYDTRQFVASAREYGFTPHVAAKKSGGAIDRRTTSQDGYHVSQRKRKRVEEIFGWGKTVGPLRKMKHRGSALVRTVVTMTAAAYNIVRMANLEAANA
jgi:transposase